MVKTTLVAFENILCKLFVRRALFGLVSQIFAWSILLWRNLSLRNLCLRQLILRELRVRHLSLGELSVRFMSLRLSSHCFSLRHLLSHFRLRVLRHLSMRQDLNMRFRDICLFNLWDHLTALELFSKDWAIWCHCQLVCWSKGKILRACLPRVLQSLWGSCSGNQVLFIRPVLATNIDDYLIWLGVLLCVVVDTTIVWVCSTTVASTATSTICNSVQRSYFKGDAGNVDIFVFRSELIIDIQ